jgi:hypothetical protein
MADRMQLRFPEAVAKSPDVDAWLAAQNGELGALARAWFAKLRACGSDVRELMHDGAPTACIGDAPFAYVAAFRDHVNVGFFHGAALADPAQLLEGTGKFMRHAKLRPQVDVDTAALSALVDVAYLDVKRKLAR